MYRIVRTRINKADPKGPDLQVETWRGASRATANKEFAKAVTKVARGESVELMRRSPKSRQPADATSWDILAMYSGKWRGRKEGMRHDLRPETLAAKRAQFLQERRSRMTDREFAHAKKGLCLWEMNDSAFDDKWCTKKAPADNFHCREHQRDARELFGATGR